MYKKNILGNGLKAVSHHMPQRQSVAVGIWIKIGGRYESKENKGISHFIEHLLFKGTKHYSCRKIKESIEGVGGSLNGFTSEELTCYLVKLPARHIDAGVDVLSDMVIDPTLPAGEVDKERTVILEEIKMYKDLPQAYVYDLLDEMLWEDQPLGMAIAGTIESVSGIDRRALSSFKEKYYTASNMVISIAGLFDEDKFLDKIGRRFSKLGASGTNRFIAAKQKQDEPQLNIFHKETEQSHLAMGFHALKREHHLKHALGMLHVILGANMSSRLFNEVREKRGLAYEIGTQVKRFKDAGAFLVHAGIDNNKVSAAIKVILMEINRIKDGLVSPGEFKRAKDFYLGQLTLALEDTLDHMLWIGESTATLNKTYSLEQISKEVHAATPEDIRKVARLVFKRGNLNLALIGPLNNSRQEIYRAVTA